MSRTYRKPRFVRELGEIQHINRTLAHHRLHPYETVRVDKPKEQYEAELEEARLEHLAAIRSAKKGVGYAALIHRLTDFRNIRCRWVSKDIWVRVHITEEQAIRKARNEYARHRRDGHWNETSRNTGFKKQAARTLRLADSRFERLVLSGEEHDDTVYPGTHLGKVHIWDWW